MPRKNIKPYVLQRTDKTFCPLCYGRVQLLCREDGEMKKAPAFYICRACGRLTQVGVGSIVLAGKDKP